MWTHCCAHATRRHRMALMWTAGSQPSPMAKITWHCIPTAASPPPSSPHAVPGIDRELVTDDMHKRMMMMKIRRAMSLASLHPVKGPPEGSDRQSLAYARAAHIKRGKGQVMDHYDVCIPANFACVSIADTFETGHELRMHEASRWSTVPVRAPRQSNGSSYRMMKLTSHRWREAAFQAGDSSGGSTTCITAVGESSTHARRGRTAPFGQRCRCIHGSRDASSTSAMQPPPGIIILGLGKRTHHVSQQC
ncbi:hypothetical protein PINS_up011637 [Pythium insidiosum]|nr:hypothetical protein PINS_up011637 [Pythium insidiosum]